ncbi:GNAT family N-acetyltransferase, partial [Vibrio vulnificus]
MQQVLETERLVLRPFELSDAEQVSVLADDKRIA